MEPKLAETRPDAGGKARGLRARGATALEVAVGRVVAAAVVCGLLASFLALAHLHRGAVVRQLIAEVGTAAQTAASTLAGSREHASHVVDAELLLRALLELHAIEQVTWLPADSAPPLCLTRAGVAPAPWQRPSEVPLGQWLGQERFRLARGVAHAGRAAESVLVVEGSLEQAVRHEAENVAHAARVFALVVLLTLFIAPWLGRQVAAPWTRALRDHHLQLCAAEPESSDPEVVLQAVERRVMAERAGLFRALPDAPARTSSEAPRPATPETLPWATPEATPAHAAGASLDQAAFLVNTSHELRTPLHAVVTTSALLLETTLDVEQRAMVERIVVAAAALDSSIGDLFELSDLERGELSLEVGDALRHEPFRPEDVLEDAVAVVAPLARDRDLELLPRVDPTLPTVVIGDAPRLRRVLVHLVDNAVRHTEHGVVDVRLAFEADPAGSSRGRLVFEVRDSGVGIPLEKQPALLAALHGVHDGEAGVRHCIGIGLALSTRVVRALGGVMDLESAPGRGSTFRAFVPVTVQAGPSMARMLTGQHALVLDDRPRSMAHASDLLLAEGASVTAETSTYAGFEALTRGERIDLVVISSSLAGRDAFLGGMEALMLGRATLPRVVLVHPILGRRLPVRALDEAVTAQLVEPVTRRSLRRALELARGNGATGSGATGNAAPGRAALSGGAPNGSASDAAPVAAEPACKAPKPISDAVRVLVVDDNETNRQLVQYLLAKRGYTVEVAVDGQAALDAFTLGEYDVILMDFQMPGMDGFEATRRMRALERSRARRTPILAMSAGAFGSDVQACRDAGMDDHIAKPFQPKELLAWLEVWVASALQGPGARGAGCAPPRRRVTAREAGLVATGEGARPRPPAEGAVDEDVLGPLLDDEGGRSLAEELVGLFSGLRANDDVGPRARPPGGRARGGRPPRAPLHVHERLGRRGPAGESPARGGARVHAPAQGRGERARRARQRRARGRAHPAGAPLCTDGGR